MMGLGCCYWLRVGDGVQWLGDDGKYNYLLLSKKR